MSLISLRPSKRSIKISIMVLLVFVIFYLALVTSFRPSHDRKWELGMEELPYITLNDEGIITIDNFRNFDWQKDDSTVPNYETRQFNINDMDSVDVFISHFDEFEGLAHIFISFGFTTGEQIVVSYETRREEGEVFSPLLGLLRQFEVIYVVGSEEDIVGVRTDVREGERVYLYETVATPEKAVSLFKALAEDIDHLYDHPRIYNTLTHNCTNEITKRVEDISDVNFPFTWKTVLPGYFDEVLYEMELIDTRGTFADVKARHKVDNNMVNRYDDTYSADLRNSIIK